MEDDLFNKGDAETSWKWHRGGQRNITLLPGLILIDRSRLHRCLHWIDLEGKEVIENVQERSFHGNK